MNNIAGDKIEIGSAVYIGIDGLAYPLPPPDIDKSLRFIARNDYVKGDRILIHITDRGLEDATGVAEETARYADFQREFKQKIIGQ